LCFKGLFRARCGGQVIDLLEIFDICSGSHHTRRPPLFAVWGKNDPFFLPPVAKAVQGDNPGAEVHLVDDGHFALESKGEEIAGIIREFLGGAVSRSSLSVAH